MFRRHTDIALLLACLLASTIASATASDDRAAHVRDDVQGHDEISPDALESYRKAARVGGADAKYELASILEQTVGTGQPEYLAVLREAAELGHGRAQHDYAIRLLEGSDVPRDDAAAARWLERSAEQGHLEPQYLLATLYERGRGVQRNPDTAIGRYRLAAELGHPKARAVMRTAAFLEGAPCSLVDPVPDNWRRIASRVGVLRVPPDASDPAAGGDTATIHATAPGLSVTFARASDAPDDDEAIILGGDALAVRFTGDAASGTITTFWSSFGTDGSVARLDVRYSEPASRDIACGITGAARLLDPLTDLELVRIDAAASPRRALLRGERSERWVVVEDIVTRDYGRVAKIERDQIEVIEIIAIRGGGAWRERLVTMRPSSSRGD